MQQLTKDLKGLGFELKGKRKVSVLPDLDLYALRREQLESEEADFLQFYEQVPVQQQKSVKELLNQYKETIKPMLEAFEKRIQANGTSQAGEKRRVFPKYYVAPYNKGVYLQVTVLRLKSS